MHRAKQFLDVLLETHLLFFWPYVGMSNLPGWTSSLSPIIVLLRSGLHVSSTFAHSGLYVHTLPSIDILKSPSEYTLRTLPILPKVCGAKTMLENKLLAGKVQYILLFTSLSQ